MSFAQPSAPNTGDNFNAKDHRGHLLIVYPKNFQENITTTKGLSDAADCDIIVVDKLDATGKPLTFFGARLFGNLARSVRNDIGGQVLGRLDQITSANGNTPWILSNFLDADMAAATPIDAAYRQGAFQPTQNPMAAPSPAAAPAWSPAPTPAPTGPPPAQQWQPQAAPAAPQWQPSPAPPLQTAAGAYAPQTGPATWPSPTAAPAPSPAPSAPVAAPAAQIDPNLLAFLAARGINGPFPDQATAEAVAATLQ